MDYRDMSITVITPHSEDLTEDCMDRLHYARCTAELKVKDNKYLKKVDPPAKASVEPRNTTPDRKKEIAARAIQRVKQREEEYILDQRYLTRVGITHKALASILGLKFHRLSYSFTLKESEIRALPIKLKLKYHYHMLMHNICLNLDKRLYKFQTLLKGRQHV